MILLSKAYGGYAAGTIAQFSTEREASLIAQGFGVTSAGPVTAGAVTTSEVTGRLGIAAAGTSVVLTNPKITAESKFIAYLSNAAADATALYITRITPAAGSVTFTLNAAATGVVAIDWALLMVSGQLQPN
jgi:hypothetical protein